MYTQHGSLEHIYIHKYICGINSFHSVYNLLKKSWFFVPLLYVGLSVTTGNLLSCDFKKFATVFRIRLVTVEKSIYLDFCVITAFHSTVMKT